MSTAAFILTPTLAAFAVFVAFALCGLTAIVMAEWVLDRQAEVQQARISDYPAIVPHLRAGRLDRALHAFTMGK